MMISVATAATKTPAITIGATVNTQTRRAVKLSASRP